MSIKGVPCPNCGKKTLSHPSLWGDKPEWADHSRVYCRTCNKRFVRKSKKDMEAGK